MRDWRVTEAAVSLIWILIKMMFEHCENKRCIHFNNYYLVNKSHSIRQEKVYK